MSGGYGSGGAVTTTKDALVFEELETMPDEYPWQHCVVGVNENMLFTTGLGDDEESYFYYKDTREWVALPNLPTRRFSMACGLVSVVGIDGSEQLEVVVVGGYEDPDKFGRLDVVEIFNIQEGSWRTGE